MGSECGMMKEYEGVVSATYVDRTVTKVFKTEE